MSKWVTVEDSQNLDPVSQITGGRRYSFEIGGQLTLVKDCYAQHGRHDFVLHSTVPGPVAFVNCTAALAYDESGPHHRWDTGVLYDNVVVSPATDGDGDPRTAGTLEAHNQGMADGHGWSGANVVFWNCTAAKIDVGKPPTAQNWAIGCTTTSAPAPTGTGFIESSNRPVQPQSLYAAQLADRLVGHHALVDVLQQVQIVANLLPPGLTGKPVALTLTNVSGADILGPVQVVLTGLPKGVTVAGATGHTAAGDPFFTLPVSHLAPGKSLTVSLRFSGPLPAHTAFGVEVYSGPLPSAPPAGGVPAPAPAVLDALFAAGGVQAADLVPAAKADTGATA
jgi:hypothetical protein